VDGDHDGVVSGRRPLGTWRARAGFEPSGKGNGHGWFHRSLQRPGAGVMRAETVGAEDTPSGGRSGEAASGVQSDLPEGAHLRG